MKFIIIATLFTYGGSYQERAEKTDYVSLQECESNIPVVKYVIQSFYVGSNHGKGTVVDFALECQRAK